MSKLNDLKSLKKEEVIKLKDLIQKYRNYEKVDLLVEMVIVGRGIC